MVATRSSLAVQSWATARDALLADLTEQGQAELEQFAQEAQKALEGMTLETGEPAWSHALGMALLASELRLDTASRLAALLYPIPTRAPEYWEAIAESLSPDVVRLIKGLERLHGVRLRCGEATPEQETIEAVRKMVLALVEDVRVVLLRLSSRVMTLRWFAKHADDPEARSYALESRTLYAPLANRLGVWRLKWEIEDLAFRLLEPETYKLLAKRLEERRSEREAFIAARIAEFSALVQQLGISPFEVTGRPKHLYSIYLKMTRKGLELERIYDLRAVRILVPQVEDCYAVLAAVHERYPPIEGEFDDYIVRPKANGYQSLHTAVRAHDGRPLEVQIRTFAMHRAAELGVAAHWRYKEGGQRPSAYDERIALLRSLLAWRDEVADANAWAERVKRAVKEEVIYVTTPAGRVIDLPKGATPIDFAYRIHTDVGHRCRGAKVDGQIVSLNTPLATGQTVEILTAKEGGPSRDWLQPGFAVTRHARSKIRLWFAQRELAELQARGRALVEQTLARAGKSKSNLEELATRLGFKDAESLFRAVARGEVGPKALVEGVEPDSQPRPPAPPRRSSSVPSGGEVLRVTIGGEGGFVAQPARCCLPKEGEAIFAFLSRSRGLTVHHVDCPELQRLRELHPERVLPANWEG
ncbi:bifunctional (p)ppGpp synthetase/guanosine-3',5'-bis(diphosphate) 3'-pyrophosphohydrolase [Hydrogenophilus islandicus]